MIGITLRIVSKILKDCFGTFAIIYTCIKFSLKPKKIDEYFYQLSSAEDQYGNVLLQHPCNDILITTDGYKFGNEDEKMSSVLGKNKLKGTNRKGGKFVSKILNKADKNHVEKSIDYKI